MGSCFDRSLFQIVLIGRPQIQKPFKFDLEPPISSNSSMVTCRMPGVASITRVWMLSAEAARERIAAKNCSRALAYFRPSWYFLRRLGTPWLNLP